MYFCVFCLCASVLCYVRVILHYGNAAYMALMMHTCAMLVSPPMPPHPTPLPFLHAKRKHISPSPAQVNTNGYLFRSLWLATLREFLVLSENTRSKKGLTMTTLAMKASCSTTLVNKRLTSLTSPRLASYFDSSSPEPLSLEQGKSNMSFVVEIYTHAKEETVFVF